ncbi:MAG: dienelactone hydrolase family protein [Alphaproteobacteria bacterium]|nr:dienelactone hydrolase family protein [Alphaproteobacteria bacterium]
MLKGPTLAPKSGQADSLVILLHGYGANGDDLISIGQEWASDLPNTAFVAPNAPEDCEANPGFGYQWFPIRVADGIVTKAFDRSDIIRDPAAALNEYIDAQLAHWGLDESRLIVGGFSQGAMMTMYTMPRRKTPCAGIIGYSGMLVDGGGLKTADIVKMPVLAIHGDADGIVPPNMLEGVYEGFDAAGFNVETIMRPGLAHGIDAFGLQRGLNFIQENLEKTVETKSSVQA